MPGPFPIMGGFGNPDPDANPTNIGELVTILNALLSLEVAGDYKPYVVGSTPPSVENQDKVWVKIDGAGRPIGTFLYYGGHWRRNATGLAQEMRYFNGNPATYFDGTGKGIIELDWDGWALANGQNGTPNLSDKFIVVGKIDDGSGYDEATNKWTSKVSGANLPTGGVKDITLTDANTFQKARVAIVVGRMTADGNGPDATGGLYGSNVTSGSITLQTADAGNATPAAIPTLPPYYAMAIVKWIGYA